MDKQVHKLNFALRNDKITSPSVSIQSYINYNLEGKKNFHISHLQYPVKFKYLQGDKRG